MRAPPDISQVFERRPPKRAPRLGDKFAWTAAMTKTPEVNERRSETSTVPLLACNELLEQRSPRDVVRVLQRLLVSDFRASRAATFSVSEGTLIAEEVGRQPHDEGDWMTADLSKFVFDSPCVRITQAPAGLPGAEVLALPLFGSPAAKDRLAIAVLVPTHDVGDGAFDTAGIECVVRLGAARLETLSLRASLLHEVARRCSAEGAVHEAHGAPADSRETTATDETPSPDRIAVSKIHELSEALTTICAETEACKQWLQHAPPRWCEGHVCLDRVADGAARAAKVVSEMRGAPRTREVSPDTDPERHI